MNKKGVTLTVLIITILTMFIIFGVTYTTSVDLLKNSQRNKMKTMLYMVQSRAEILLDSFMFENDGKTIEQLTSSSSNVSTLGGIRITVATDLYGVGVSSINAGEIYCSWSEETLKSQGIDTNNLANGDTIIVKYDLNTETIDVASTKGTSVDGINYHFLSEFED